MRHRFRASFSRSCPCSISFTRSLSLPAQSCCAIFTDAAVKSSSSPRVLAVNTNSRPSTSGAFIVSPWLSPLNILMSRDPDSPYCLYRDSEHLCYRQVSPLPCSKRRGRGLSLLTHDVPAVCDATVATPQTRLGSCAATVKQGLPPKDHPMTTNRLDSKCFSSQSIVVSTSGTQ